jgi:hypothetical protein
MYSSVCSGLAIGLSEGPRGRTKMSKSFHSFRADPEWEQPRRYVNVHQPILMNQSIKQKVRYRLPKQHDGNSYGKCGSKVPCIPDLIATWRILTTHLHLMRSRTRGAIIPLLQYASVAWCSVKSTGTLPFYYMEERSPSRFGLEGVRWTTAWPEHASVDEKSVSLLEI